MNTTDSRANGLVVLIVESKNLYTIFTNLRYIKQLISKFK